MKAINAAGASQPRTTQHSILVKEVVGEPHQPQLQFLVIKNAKLVFFPSISELVHMKSNAHSGIALNLIRLCVKTSINTESVIPFEGACKRLR